MILAFQDFEMILWHDYAVYKKVQVTHFKVIFVIFY